MLKTVLPYYEKDGKGVWAVFDTAGFGDDETEMRYIYTLDPSDNDGDFPKGAQFDIRDLPQYTPDLTHDEVISAAVEEGDLTLEFDVLPNGMIEVTVALIPEVEEGVCLSAKEIAACAEQAVKNAMNYAVDEGLLHSRMDDLSFPKVEITDVRT